MPEKIFYDFSSQDTPIPGEGTPDPEEKGEARELNAKEWKEIYPYRIEKGRTPKIKQGRGLGECYFALGLSAIQECEIYHKFLDQCIRKTDDGWEVSFWGADFPVVVKKEKINQGPRQINSNKGPKVIDELDSPNDVDRIIERAYATYEKIRSPTENNEADTMQYIDAGGFSHHFLQILLGEYYDYDEKYKTITAEDDPYDVGHTMMFAKTNKTLIECDPRTIEMVFNFLEEKSSNSKDIVITCGTPAKGKYNRSGELHERVKKGRDEFGSSMTYADKKGRFVSRHAFGVRSCVLNPKRLEEALKTKNYSGLGTLEIVNPWDTRKTEIIDFSEFLEIFRLVSPVKIHKTPIEVVKQKDIKLDTGQELEITDTGKDHVLAAGGTIFIVSKENGMWKWTNTDTQKSKIIHTHELGQSFSIGRELHFDSIFRGTSLSLSRHHFDVVFGSESFTVKSVSRSGKTVIKESKEHRPEDWHQESSLYINDAISKIKRENDAKKIWQMLREKKDGKYQHPYFSYDNIDDAIINASLLKQNFDSAVLEELEQIIQKKGKNINNKVPETTSHVKVLRTKDNILIIFYIDDDQVYYTHYNPRVSSRPRTGSEQMIELLRRVMSQKGEKNIPDIPWAQQNHDRLHLNISTEVFEKCLPADVLDPFDRLDFPINKAQVTVGSEAEEYTITRYDEYDFQWRKVKKPEQVLEEVQNKVEEAMSLDEQQESIHNCLNHNNTDIFHQQLAEDLPLTANELHKRKDIAYCNERSQVEGKIIKEREVITSDGELICLMELQDGRIAFYYSEDEFWEQLSSEYETENSLRKCIESLPVYLPYTKDQILKALSQVHKKTEDSNDNIGLGGYYISVSSCDGHHLLFHKEHGEFKLTSIFSSEEQEKKEKKTAELLAQLKTPYSTVYDAISHPIKLNGITVKDLKESDLLKADKYKQSEDHEWSYLFAQSEDGWNIIFEINLEKKILHAKTLPKA